MTPTEPGNLAYLLDAPFPFFDQCLGGVVGRCEHAAAASPKLGALLIPVPTMVAPKAS